MKSMEIYGFRTLNSELCTQNNCIIHPSLSSTRPHHPPVPIIHPSPSSTRPHHPPVPIIHPSPLPNPTLATIFLPPRRRLALSLPHSSASTKSIIWCGVSKSRVLARTFVRISLSVQVVYKRSLSQSSGVFSS